MTNAAVADSSVADTQTATQSTDTQATTPQGGAAPTASAGTDGGQPPANGATAQTALSSEPASPDTAVLADATPTPPPPSPPALTEDQLLELAEKRIAAREEARKAAEAQQQTLADLKALRRDTPKKIRGLFDQIAEEANIVIPAAIREAAEDLLESYNLKALEAAKVELGDLAESRATEVASEYGDLFKAAVYKGIPKDKVAAFNAKVNGQGYEEWLEAYVEHRPGVYTTETLVDEARAVAEDAGSTLTAAEAKALTESLKGKKTARDILATVAQAMLQKGQRGPGAQPVGGERNGGQVTRNYAWWMNASVAERQSVSPAEEQRIFAEESRRKQGL